MKFGKSIAEEIGFYSIPDSHPIIDELPATDQTTVHLGGTQWGLKAYVGPWYETGTIQKNFLPAYGRQFGCVELNATHYRIFPPEKFADWSSAVPENFRFLPKLPQSISHYRRLNNTKELVHQYCEGVRLLSHKMGTCFLQMPESFHSSNQSKLLEWLNDWPNDVRLSIELRHPSWFENPFLVDELSSFLHAKKIGWVITDSPGRKDVLHMAVTAPFVMIRYAGWELHPMERTRLSNWTDRILDWKEQGVKDIFFCIHQPENIATPETAIALSELLKKASPDIAINGIPKRLSLF